MPAIAQAPKKIAWLTWNLIHLESHIKQWIASFVAANPGAVMRMTKRLLREGEHSTLESLLELSAGYQALAHKTADHREAVMSFVEKRKPRFQ